MPPSALNFAEISLPRWPTPASVLGDASVLRRPMTAFFCSRRFPARAVLPVLDWAKEARERGEVVLSGFHSNLERDALETLLAGNAPAVMATARGLPRRLRPDARKGLESGKLILASPFPAEVRRQTAETAALRNRFILAVASQTVVGWAAPDGALPRLLDGAKIPVRRLCAK